VSAAHPIAGHFETREQQREAATLGMWVFLATELMFFGPLFLAYLYGRTHYGNGFAVASAHTHVGLGTSNTAILLTSSLTMALAVRATWIGSRRAAAWLLAATAALGIAFLAVKGVEYRKEWEEALVPPFRFVFLGEHARAAEVFYWLYFLMTGLHALHLTIGVLLVLWLARRARRGEFGPSYHAPVEMTGLYWHFVDVVWIFLYPLIYLLERWR
jgi:cytochrome c oxidase subunit 3